MNQKTKEKKGRENKIRQHPYGKDGTFISLSMSQYSFGKRSAPFQLIREKYYIRKTNVAHSFYTSLLLLWFYLVKVYDFWVYCQTKHKHLL